MDHALRGIRVEATVLGPGAPGYLKVLYRPGGQSGGNERIVDVPIENIPQLLRVLNTPFVGILQGGEIVGASSSGSVWIVIQDRIRPLLMRWDPIGLGEHCPADEYDAYIGGIYSLLRRRATREEISQHLREIEMASMGLSPGRDEKRLLIADALLALELPDPVLHREMGDEG